MAHRTTSQNGLMGLSLAALSLAGAVAVVGCKSNDPPQRKTTAPPAAQVDVQIDKVDPSQVEPVQIRGHAGAEMGGPPLYTLKLINRADDLPATIAQQGLTADFDTHSVVLLGMGKQKTSGYAAKITGLQKVGDTIYVQARFTRPGQGAAVAQVLTFPWAAVLIDKQPAGTTLRSDFD